MKKIKKITLGFSVLSEYRKCPTKFSLSKLERLNKSFVQDNTQGSALTFGTYWHRFQELYHSGDPAASQKVLDEGIKDPISTVYPEAKRSLAHLGLLMDRYKEIFPDPYSDFKPYKGIAADRNPFEFEVEFQISTNPIIMWRQRYDGIVALPDSSATILEHKTSSSDLRNELRKRMMPNAQAVGYVYGARRALGIPVTGVLFNGACTYRPLVNPGYRYRGNGSPMPLFLREFVPVEEWRLDEWLLKTARTVKRMVEDIEDNVFGDDAPDSCTIFNGRCKFAQICNAAPIDRDRVKKVDYEADTYEGFKIEYE